MRYRAVMEDSPLLDGFCALRYIDYPRYLEGDTTPEMEKKANGRRMNIDFGQTIVP